jgi:hypothetical protein
MRPNMFISLMFMTIIFSLCSSQDDIAFTDKDLKIKITLIHSHFGTNYEVSNF